MSLDVRADPKRPNGGYAEIVADPAKLPEGEATVTIFDAFSERYLGEGGWQTERASFGPYPVAHEDGKARLVIGPEIVNEIEEYAVLKMTVGELSGEVNWPDDVFPLPGAARLGGLHVARSEPKPASPNLVQTVTPTAPEPEPEPTPEPAPVADPPAGADGRSRTPLFIGLAVLVLAALAAGWFFLMGPTDTVEEPAPVAAAPEPAPAPEPQNPCAADAFAALASAPFAERSALMLRCAGQIDADTAFTIIEDGAVSGDADALALMAELYDPEVNSSPVEEQIGISLNGGLTLAADYYARARAAGNTAVTQRLTEICDALRAQSDTEARNAVEEFCTR